MWAIEDSPGPKAAYRGGWYHFTSGYTTHGLICGRVPVQTYLVIVGDFDFLTVCGFIVLLAMIDFFDYSNN